MPTPNHPAPKDHTDWPTPVVEAYYAALGRFLQTFGDTEASFLFQIDRYAGGLIAEDINRHTPPSEFWGRTFVQMDVIRALVGSKRSADMAKTIKLLLRIAKRPDAEQELARQALDHFGHIRALRDRIAHSGAKPFYNEGWFFRSANSLEVQESSKAKLYVFRIEDLEDMTADLKAIRLRLGVATLYDNPGFQEFAKSHGAFDPWRYKPVQPVVLGRKQSKILGSNHRLLQSPFDEEFDTAASYPMSRGGPLVYAGKPRPTKDD